MCWSGFRGAYKSFIFKSNDGECHRSSKFSFYLYSIFNDGLTCTYNALLHHNKLVTPATLGKFWISVSDVWGGRPQQTMVQSRLQIVVLQESKTFIILSQCRKVKGRNQVEDSKKEVKTTLKTLRERKGNDKKWYEILASFQNIKGIVSVPFIMWNAK